MIAKTVAIAIPPKRNLIMVLATEKASNATVSRDTCCTLP
jgi:hypothetical protein